MQDLATMRPVSELIWLYVKLLGRKMEFGINLLLIVEFSSLEDVPPHKSGVWEDEGQW